MRGKSTVLIPVSYTKGRSFSFQKRLGGGGGPSTLLNRYHTEAAGLPEDSQEKNIPSSWRSGDNNSFLYHFVTIN
jgi:hypothetical protein